MLILLSILQFPDMLLPLWFLLHNSYFGCLLLLYAMPFNFTIVRLSLAPSYESFARLTSLRITLSPLSTSQPSPTTPSISG